MTKIAHQIALKEARSEGKKNIIKFLIQEYDIHTIQDIQDALKDLLGETIQDMLHAEMNEHLGYGKYERSENKNYRNGVKPKTVRSNFGELDIEVPQDRDSSFEPKIVAKRNKDIYGIENKIIGMYAKGLSTRQIAEQIEDIYGCMVSEGFISDVTDKLLPQIEEWQNRPLSEIYPIVFIDAIHYSTKIEGIIRKIAVYVVLGINMEGRKEVLGIYIGANESSKYWLSVLNELKNRGVKDIFIICADGLTGIKEAIGASFEKAEYQRCIVHQVRNTLKYVSDKDKRELAKDLKLIYHAVNEDAAYKKLESVKDKWKEKYPNVMKSWEKNWDVLSPIFKFSSSVRKVIYTTNAIESLNSTYRRLNRSRSVFPNETALLKALYLATLEATKKWTMPLRDWYKVWNELEIMYGDRLPQK
jgi:transposase-like protein